MTGAGLELRHLHVPGEILTSVLYFHPFQKMLIFAEKVIIST